MSAICKITAGTLFNIDEDEAVQSAMAFINVYTLPSIFLFWSYVYNIVYLLTFSKTI